MRRLQGNKGVTLIELLIVMSIIMFVITAASRLLATMLTQFKQQTKIAETGVEALVGLEILRRDLYGAGYGLPHSFQGNINYEEAKVGVSTAFNDSAANDPPRALLSGVPGGTVNGSDYLVIKSLTVADNSAAGKFHFLMYGNTRSSWDTADDNLDPNDRIIVLFSSTDDVMTLAMDGSEWRPGGVGAGLGTFLPDTNTEGYAPPPDFASIIYGVDADSNLRFPFNRADYYVTNGVGPYASKTRKPLRCAPGTGVLVKAVLDNNADNTLGGDFDISGDGYPDELPILDCVLDMQVAVRLDTNGDFDIDDAQDDNFLLTLDAEEIRAQVKEIRIYILAHEGQFDPTYEHPVQNILVGENFADLGIAVGRNFDLLTVVGDKWMNYRWRLYTLVVKPQSLNPKIG